MLRERLINIFYNTATGNPRVKALLTPVGPLFFLGLLALLVIASLWMDRLLRLPKWPGRPLNLVFSVPLLAFGTFLIAWSVITFFKKKGTPVPFNPPPELVDQGPYSWSRNPMLTGLFAVLFGVGVHIRSISMIFLFTPFFIGLMVWEIKAVEEPELEKRLGKEYLRYRKRVGMFWPGRKR